MKQGIHPEYRKVIFLDTTTNFKFLSGSTKYSSETMEWEDGNEYPVIRLDISSDSHPFYTGRQKICCCRWSCGTFQQEIRSQIKQLIFVITSYWKTVKKTIFICFLSILSILI